ncbi:hypothetical protein SR39_30260 [Methylobacterium radiotolerans]|jgi:hypothetical protein|uniref:Uncharacterized protein n=2 Tax=Methylobacterium TaxID=407 RepID=A0AA37TR91_9HYPH|nr:hypothetical protein A3862_06760 [Methylobacterium sp. XJLW]KIU27323.1 hypothetical protein SR39_30260 [Methylobacterium radiotolerans]GLS72843.1 hypothetical protein GCM10007890_48580 [Methylobacterium tardum]
MLPAGLPIYRFRDLATVYGTACQEPIQGSSATASCRRSALDMDVAQKAKNERDRVRPRMSGKLPLYKRHGDDDTSNAVSRRTRDAGPAGGWRAVAPVISRRRAHSVPPGIPVGICVMTVEIDKDPSAAPRTRRGMEVNEVRRFGGATLDILAETNNHSPAQENAA